MRRLVAAGLLLVFTTVCSGCARQAMILSEPPGAEVLVDGKTIGVTPCVFSYNEGPGGFYSVELRHQGYQPLNHAVEADLVDSGSRKKWLAAGLVWSPLWLGTFFTKKLKDGYRFVLQKDEATLTAMVDGSSKAN